MIKLENVSKKFGEITALSDVSFEINEGEFVFICGPSGSGKTTLLRLILRELLPDEGEIILEEADITKLPSKEIPHLRQNIGVVFQDFKVLAEMTVWENVEVALAVINLPKTDWGARVEHVLKLVGLTHRATLFPSQLSGGELQRVSLARALVVNPKIILADEPTGNLDWDTAQKLMDLFIKVNKEGKTIIMATHNKLIVDKMGKRVIELKEGKLISDKGSARSKESKEKSAKKVKA